MPWTKLDNVAPLTGPMQEKVIAAVNAERQRKALAHNSGRHRTETEGVSRRAIGLLSAAVLAGSGIAYLATSYGFLP
ncbi:hypothetical protein ACFVWF_32900 [Rhodococcus qingshengii]|uniref:hypothetical protein n=1 Tax=Rhodococcus qingshengii TaxID=334542 RepID=UPI0036D9CC6A